MEPLERPSPVGRRRPGAIGRLRSAWSSVLAHPRAVPAYLAFTGIMVVLVVVVDRGRPDLAAPVVGLASAALLVRAARAPAPDRGAWAWLACGTLLWCTGDLLWALAETSFPSAWAYLASYAVFGVGVARLSGRRSRAKVLDAAIVSLAISLWLLVLLDPPVDRLGHLGIFEAVVTVGYAAGDVVLLGCALSLLMGRADHNRSLHLLSAGLLVIMVADLFWLYPELSGTFETGSLVDGGWLGAYGLFGAAALHPHRRTTGHSERVVPMHRRALLLATAVVSGPVALAVHDGPDAGLAVLLSGVAILLAVLAGTRMALLVVELGRAARYDPLTGTLSRVGLADSTGHEGGYALLFCDVDQFKLINDTYGHDVGDAVLGMIARRIASQLRAEDRVARFGGDEFVVICPGFDDGPGTELMARRMRRALETTVAVEPHGPIPVTVSVGATWALPGETFQQALRRADAEMYRAKRTAVSVARP